MIQIERSRVDDRWCVASRYRETLCSWRLVPIVVLVTLACWWRDRRNARRMMRLLRWWPYA